MTKKRKTTKKKSKQASTGLNRIFITGGIVTLLALAALICYSYCFTEYKGEECRLNIPRDATDASISDYLHSTLGADMGSKVDRLRRIQGGTATSAHGSYLITPGESALNIGRRLAKGRQTPVKISWAECRTTGDIAARISKSIEADSAETATAIANVLNSHGVAPENHIGVLLPDTYEVYWSRSAERIVEKIYEAYTALWSDENKAKARELKLTPEQVSVLASIAEEETADAEERAVVARLYINRLNINMPLQADPTVRYAIGDYTIRRVTNKHTRYDSPYNTYLHKGLPPGPIRNPSAKTIRAILNSSPNPYLYMCAKEDFSGKHNFASDYPTHLANAARYQAELNRRGIR
ncbi:MAG: endolytic transglycosylase MltG [Muribaculaceae bacterium]|nr:endolytic transglycosylase MltG [Muribaculaceae bacterium]